jgi:hypothetical protein
MHDLTAYVHCRLALGCVMAECAYVSGLVLLWQASPVATMWLLVVPYFITSFSLMVGNWWATFWHL